MAKLSNLIIEGGQMGGWTGGCRWMGRDLIDRWMDRELDGWANRCMGRYMDEWMDEWM